MKFLIKNDFVSPLDLMNHLRDIAEKCNGQSDVVIEFENGCYDIEDESAINDFNRLMKGDLDYDTHWGKGNIDYNKGLVFQDVHNLKVIGHQSTLIFDGLIAPFTFINCHNVYVEGLTIDWKRPPFTIGKIVSVNNKTVSIKLHEDFSIEGGEPIWALMDHDPYRKRFGKAWQFRNMSSVRKLSDDFFEFDTDAYSELVIGHDIVLRHVGNYRPCIHILESKNLYFKDLTIHNNPGMGVVGHYSENITFRNLKVMPKRDHIMSTTTDATHFINCEGLLDFENCYFEGMGDDAINVHGFYNYITEIIDDYTLEVTILNENGTQDQIFDIPKIGDVVEFSRVYDLKPIGVDNKIKSYKVNELQWKAALTFENKLSDEIGVGDLLTKSNDVAALRFVKCHVKSIRARACLIQTRNVIIEDCLIENCTGTGIHLDTATGWWESVRCKDVSIRHNIIRDCGYGDGTYHNTSGIAVITESEGDAVGIHSHILIENNEIYGNQNTGITVQCTNECQIIRNKIKNCDIAVDIAVSDNILIQDNDTQNQKIKFRFNQ